MIKTAHKVCHYWFDVLTFIVAMKLESCSKTFLHLGLPQITHPEIATSTRKSQVQRKFLKSRLTSVIRLCSKFGNKQNWQMCRCTCLWKFWSEQSRVGGVNDASWFPWSKLSLYWVNTDRSVQNKNNLHQELFKNSNTSYLDLNHFIAKHKYDCMMLHPISENRHTFIHTHLHLPNFEQKNMPQIFWCGNYSGVEILCSSKVWLHYN